MTTPYPAVVNLVNDGEQVDAAVTNRPTAQLVERTDSLLEKVNDGLFGSNRILYDQPLISSTVVGTPVYFNNNQSFYPAVFGYNTSIEANYTLANSSYVVGLVGYKTNATLGNVLLSGLLVLSAAQLEAITQSGQVETGQLFLSPSTPGLVTTLTPPIGIPVGFCAGPDANGNYRILVACNPQNLLYQHIHYRVPLTMAATNPTVGSPAAGWVNTTTYASWFASTSITIPAGATYYYLISADPVLSALWPPQPLAAAVLQRNGINMRLDGSNPVVSMNTAGIWYLSATYPPIGEGNVTTVAAQFDVGGYPDRIDLLFLETSGSTSVVTSLTNDDGTVQILNAAGTASASTGALLVRANLPINEAEDTAGYLAVKSITSGTLNLGVVLEGIAVDPASGLVITGGTPVDEVSGPASGFIGGRLTLGFTNPNGPLQGEFDAVSFDDVIIEDITGNGVFGWTFRAGIQATLQGRVRMPTQGIPSGGLNCAFELTVAAMATGTLPTLDTTLQILPQPVEIAGNGSYTLQLPVSDTSFANINLGNNGSGSYTISAGYYTKKTSGTVLVHAGDLVILQLQRAASDGYSGDLSILDLKYILTAP